MSQYLAVIEEVGPGSYSAYCPDLAGVIVTGDTPDECRDAMRKVLVGHIAAAKAAGESVPAPACRGVPIEIDT